MVDPHSSPQALAAWRAARVEAFKRLYGVGVQFEPFALDHPLAKWVVGECAEFGRVPPTMVLVHTGKANAFCVPGGLTQQPEIHIGSELPTLLTEDEQRAAVSHELDHAFRVDPRQPREPDDRISLLTEVTIKEIASYMVMIGELRKMVWRHDEMLPRWKSLATANWNEGVKEACSFEYLADAAAAMRVGKSSTISGLQKGTAAMRRETSFLFCAVYELTGLYPSLAKRVAAIENETYFAEAAQLYRKPFYPKAVTNG